MEMTELERLVIVGASLAGLRSAEAARRAGFAGDVILIGEEPHLPYDRPPLSKAYLDSPDVPSVTYRALDELVELGVDLRLGAAATALDVAAREVTVGDGTVPYDALVIATGSSARTLPGCDGLAGVHTLRTVDDAAAVRGALDAGARTVVIGAGFIGSEVASGARKRGLPVTVLEGAEVPLVRAVGTEMGVAVSSLHARNGTDLRCGVSVSGISRTDDGLRVDTADGTSYPADLVVVGVGASATTAWLEGSGLKVEDGIVCDDALWTGVPGVYAAGDVARWTNPLFGRSMRLEHWTSAAEQGAIAALNAIGHPRATYSTVPYFWSDWYDTRIQFVGVPDTDEIRVVEGSSDEARFVALYRSGNRLAGALCVGYPARTMKLKRLIAGAASWADALDFVGVRV
jgi:NADPH-dependent 2,4-dienoyl-CoA reductase/sulfur reductase-like enzyme